jgi:hypothetical protein
MKICLKSFAVRWLPLVAMMILVAGTAWSQDGDGAISEKLSQRLYCDTKDLIEGNIGIMIGLIMVFMGIWAMVKGAKIMAAVPLIFIGAILTALPSIAEVSIGGVNNLLIEAGISKKPDGEGAAKGFDPGKITCTTEEAINAAHMNPQTGVFYPSRGAYGADQIINNSTPDIEYGPQVPPELQN